MKLRSLAALLLALALVGCGWFDKKGEIDVTADWSAQRLYNEAKEEMSGGNWNKAVQLFEKLEARYPFGRYAQQAQLEIAYAYYKDKDTASAIAAAERFIKLHPNHPNVDYAFYIRGLTNYEQRVGFMERMMPSRVRDRDQTAARLRERGLEESTLVFFFSDNGGPTPSTTSGTAASARSSFSSTARA